MTLAAGILDIFLDRTMYLVILKKIQYNQPFYY